MGERRTSERVTWLLPALLSATAGAVEAIGFLALGGIFTAHITANLMVLAARCITGRFDQIGPLLAVPVFFAVLALVTSLYRSAPDLRTSRRAMLIWHAALIASALAIGVALSPLSDTAGAAGIAIGMLIVSAMAMQTAVVRMSLPGSPSTAMLTTNATVLAIDLATLTRRKGGSDELTEARRRIAVTLPCVAGFVTGGALGVFLEIHLQLAALAMPLVLAAFAIPLGELWRESRIATIGKRPMPYVVRARRASGLRTGSD